MQNTSQVEGQKNPKMVFDLKGSTVGRKVFLEKKFWEKSFDQKKIMKDMNYLEIVQHMPLLRMDPY
jgi:hypothetical protein